MTDCGKELVFSFFPPAGRKKKINAVVIKSALGQTATLSTHSQRDQGFSSPNELKCEVQNFPPSTDAFRSSGFNPADSSASSFALGRICGLQNYVIQ